MHKILKNFKEAFFLVTKHWPVFLVTALLPMHTIIFHLLPPSKTLVNIISLLYFFLDFGWLGTRLKIFQHVYQNGVIPWRSLPKIFSHSVKKLFPAVLLMYAFFVGIFLFFIYSYITYTATNESIHRDSNGEISKSYKENLTKKLMSKDNITQYTLQSSLVALPTQIVITIMGVIIGITLAIFTVDEIGIFTALKKSFIFVKDNIKFSGMYFVILTIIAQLHTITTPLVLKDVVGVKPLDTLPMHLMNIPYLFINLVIEATTIIYYLRNRKVSKEKTEHIR